MKKPDLKQILYGKKDNEFSSGTKAYVKVSDIRNGIISLTDGNYVSVIEILPINFHLKSEIEQKNIIGGFFSWLKIAPNRIQIVVSTENANIDNYCENQEEFYKKERNPNCRQMIFEDARLVNYIAENEALTRRFYIVLPYEGSSDDINIIENELIDTVSTAAQYLESCGLETVRQKDNDRFLYNLLYSYYRPRSKENTDYPEDIQDSLAPDSIDIRKKDYICVEDKYTSVFYLSGGGYPTSMGAAWLAPLTEAGKGTELIFILERLPREKILPKISNTTMINRSRMRDVGDTRTDFEELDDAVESGLYIKSSMNRDGEDFYYMHTLLSVHAEDTETLKQREKQLYNLCTALNFTLRKADFVQDKAFLSTLPLLMQDKDIMNKSRRNILTGGAAAAFPFSSFELCDDSGIFYGLNLHNNSAVIIDHFNTTRYSNGNMAVFGMSGAGKTFFLLLTAMRLSMQGVQVYMITPEKGFEYRNVCEAVGGKFVQIGAGSEDCINLMEIRRTTLDIDAELSGSQRDNHSVLLEKVQNLHIFFYLLCPGITPEDKYLLDKAILECYTDFGITRDNATLIDKNGRLKKMPCFADLILRLEQYPELKNISLALKRLVEGSASGLGGQTNIDLNAPFIVLDTSRLGKEFTALGTFIATEFVRDRISVSRISKKAIILDEAWKIAGEQGNEQAAEFVIELVKTVRGYGAVFISATQNVIDYFSLDDGKFGDALLGNSRIKLLLQLEETEAVKLKEKLMLTENEMMEIIRCARGQGLLCAGKNRISIEIRASETEFDLITTDRESL